MSDKKILVGDMSRETAIGILKLMLEAMEAYDSIASTSQRRNAVQMAIASLETDEAYQLEFERTTTPQEPRKGHWIGHREHCENLGVMPSGLGSYEWCSNCDCGIDVREWHRNHYNFCPNCGADMREVEE